MGEKITSSSGKGHSAIRNSWLRYPLFFIAGILLVVFAETIAREVQASEMEIAFQIAGIILIVGGFIETVIKNNCIAQIKINVYENGVDGTGVNKNFQLGAYRPKYFKLTYDQITSVDTAGNNVLVIHASGMQYKCYVNNAAAIQDAIFNQRNK